MSESSPNRRTPGSSTQLLRLAFGHVPAQIIYVAISLRLPDLLTEGTRTVSDLAAATGCQIGPLQRLLRALSAFTLVREEPPGTFALTEEGSALRADVPGSIRALVLAHLDADTWGAWGRLLDTVRGGEPATGAADGFTDPRFAEATAVGTRAEAPMVASCYDFGRFRSIVDVGGGTGDLLAAILRTYPALRGVLFDVPRRAARAAQTFRENGVEDRAEVVTGDAFAGVPTGADGYLLKSVLHGWDDDACRTVLRRCRQALAPLGRVIVLDLVAPASAGAGLDPFLAVSDMTAMLTGRGRQRTEAEFRDLLESADLSLEAVLRVPGPNRLLEARAR